jgi:YVTN family beta-propeller protein
VTFKVERLAHQPFSGDEIGGDLAWESPAPILDGFGRERGLHGVYDLRGREIRRGRFQVLRLGLVWRAERKYAEAETGSLGNNAGMIREVCFMYSNNRNGSRAARAQGFMALCAVLAMGIALAASPAAAAPFAYVANISSDTVSVIDTGTNTVVATVAVGAGNGPFGVAVTPDGKHAYVTDVYSSNVSVMDTASNAVVATVP